MQFTGLNTVYLPQVSKFSFSLSGIKTTNTGLASFIFADTGANIFPFYFSGGYIITDKIIGTYNSVEEQIIDGYVDSGLFNYKINGIFNQKSTPFTKLNYLKVSGSSGVISANILINSNPINYSTKFSGAYQCYGILTGTIYTDTALRVNVPSFLFYNSRKKLLNNPYSTFSGLSSGVNYFSFTDIDDSFIEYTNSFFVSFPTTFGDLGGKFSSERTGVTNKYIISLDSSANNTYYQTSLFDGTWSGSGQKFYYVDNPLTYNLSFSCSNTNFIGDNVSGSLKIDFRPIAPQNNSGYFAQYITGFNLISGGQYSNAPTGKFTEYYYITGIQNSLSSLLFSTGCANSLNVIFAGGNYVSGASGILYLKTANLSGIYGPGVRKFKIISGYSGTAYGWAYQSIPTFSVATGGICYSLPDYSGIETSQFKKATGYGAPYTQAGGLSAIIVMTGSGVSGLQMGNIGFGYSNSLLPKVTFMGGGMVKPATGNFLLKDTGTYNFNNFWNISYNAGNDFAAISGYVGYYSGNYGFNGRDDFSLLIMSSGIDNTSPISGMLTMIVSGNGNSLTGQKIISQSRIFNMDTGALLPNSFPTNTIIPLKDLSYSFGANQDDSQYQIDAGIPIDTIINF